MTVFVPGARARNHQARLPFKIQPDEKKDDAVDADLLLDLLRKHQDRLRPGGPMMPSRARFAC
jgi:hypothetical protein